MCGASVHAPRSPIPLTARLSQAEMVECSRHTCLQPPSIASPFPRTSRLQPSSAIAAGRRVRRRRHRSVRNSTRDIQRGGVEDATLRPRRRSCWHLDGVCGVRLGVPMSLRDVLRLSSLDDSRRTLVDFLRCTEEVR